MKKSNLADLFQHKERVGHENISNSQNINLSRQNTQD